MNRVGTHVGNVAFFVQLLGDLHRLARGQAQLAVGLLLQRRSGERWRWLTYLAAFADACDFPFALEQAIS